MPTKRKPVRKSSPKRRPVRNPAARGTGPIATALRRIEREVGEYAGQKDADAAVKALVLVVPVKTNVAEHKKDIKEALIRDRGESDRQYVTEAVKSGKPGVYVRASEVIKGPHYLFEADLCLIHGGRFGGTEHSGQVVYMRTTDLVLSKAVAIDGNMEEFPIKEAADAIIAAYAFGETNRGRGPWYEKPGRSRY